MRKIRVVALTSVVCSFFAASASFAVDYTWAGGPSGDWNIPANWLPDTGTPSTANDNATFNEVAPVAVAIPDTITLRQLIVTNAPVTLTVASGATLNFSNSGGAVINAGADLLIDGDGEITFSRNGTSETDFADIRPVAGVTVTFAARITGLPGSGVELNLTGTIVLTNPGNSFTGVTRMSAAGVIQFTHPGALGFGAMRLEQSSPAKFAYTGLSSATVTNSVHLVGNIPLLENAGDGALTLDGPISAVTTGNKAFTLASPTGQDITLNGPVSNGASPQVSLTHLGPGLLTLNSALTYSGNTTLRAPCVFNGSTSSATFVVEQGASLTFGPTADNNSRVTIGAGCSFTIHSGAIFRNTNFDMGANAILTIVPAADSAITFPPNNNLNGENVCWVIPAAANTSTNTFPSLNRADAASLDIIADKLGTPQNTLLIGSFSAGPLPSWLTVNGTPAAYDTDLGVVPVATTPAGLDALGPSVIPDDPLAAAVINAKGTGGGITVADPLTTIFSLTQDWAGDPAVVNLGGQTLAASVIDITAQGNDLTLTNGILTGPANDGGESFLALRNFSETSRLFVPAALADPSGTTLSFAKYGPGDVTLGGPVSFSGSLLINAGALILDTPAGDATVLPKPVSGQGKLVKAGLGDLTLSVTGTYSGGTDILGGTVYHGDAPAALGTGPVTIKAGAALDITNGARAVANTVTVEGDGPDGLGALRNSSPTLGQNNAFLRVTLTGDTSLFSANRFDVRGGAFDFGGHSLTLNGGGQFSIVGSAISNVTSTVAVNVVDGLFNFETSNFQGSPANLASIASGAGVALYNMSSPMLWSLLLDDDAYFRINSGLMNTNLNIWAGPVSLAGGTARLNALADGSATITGAISGPGGLLKEGPGWFWLLNPANTYQDATTVTQGNLYAVSPASIGTSGNLTVTGDGASFLARAAAAGSPDGWTKPEIETTLTGGAFMPETYFGIDTCYEDFDYTAAYPHTGIKKLGPHKLTLSGAAPDLGGITVYDGELDLTGSGDHRLHSAARNVYVGAQADATKLGILRLENTSLDLTDPGYNTLSPIFGAGIVANGRGIIHIGDNARANGRLRLGVEANAYGIIHQTSGVFTNMGGTGYGANLGVNGHAYYRLDGGHLAHKGSTLFGENDGSTAIYEQRGGTALINPGVAPGNGVVGDYYNGSFSTRRGFVQFMLSDGSLNLSAHTFTMGEWGGNNSEGHASLTIESGAEMLGVTILTLANRNGAPEAFINLNGGTLTLTNNATIVKGGNNQAGNTSRAAINFDGGTLRVSPNIRTAYSLVQTSANNAPALLNAFPGGATLDIARPTANVRLDLPLRAPAGFGVTAVNLDANGSGYIAPPVVTFSGGNGTGATAFAEIDLSGKLAAIRVTSPGVGYTTAPAVSFRGGGGTGAAATATIGGVMSGGLTKLGPGLLTLNAENTYIGPTAVADGTLRLNAGPKTLSPASPITLTGGTLDLNGLTVTNYNPVTIEGGSIVNGTLAAASFAKTGPGAASLSATLAAVVSPAAMREAFIQSLGPIVWYDPSDASSDNMTLDEGRVTRLRNKGTAGPSLDAIPRPSGTGPRLMSGVGVSCAPFGANVLRVDTAEAPMTTAGNVPITGSQPRTLIAMLARDNGQSGVPTGRASVSIGSGTNTQGFEIGNDSGKTYLSALSLDLNFDGTAGYAIPPVDRLTFMAAANNGNDPARDMQIWRSIGPDAAFDTRSGSWTTPINTATGPFKICWRDNSNLYRGWIGEVLLFDRILTADEMAKLKDTLTAKWLTDGDDGGEAAAIPPVAVEDGTLILAPIINEDTIAALNPILWYDPSDTTPANMTLASGRVTWLRNKGTAGPGLDAIPFNSGAGPFLQTLQTSPATPSPQGAALLSIDNAGGAMTTAAHVPITGNAPRTLIALLARNPSRVCVGIGDGDRTTFEIGNDPAKTYLTGRTLDLDFVPVDGIPDPDQLTFIAAANGHNGNFWRDVQIWRCLGTDAPLETKTTTWNNDVNITSAPFSLSRRGGTANTGGKVAEVLLFDRVLNEAELADVKNYLIIKWVSGSQSDGTEFDGVTFDVSVGATLDLGGNERSGITVTGSGAIVNGTLGDGFIISPAGDDAIGELAFDNVTFGVGTEYRLTTIGNDSDCILVDGDLSALTIVPATDDPPTGKSYVIATGNITGRPTLDGFPSKYKLLKQGNDLLLTSTGGTVLILR